MGLALRASGLFNVLALSDFDLPLRVRVWKICFISLALRASSLQKLLALSGFLLASGGP